MNEILFKAWDNLQCCWFLPPDSWSSIIGSSLMTLDGRTYIKGVFQDLLLCQYINEIDVNKKKIFEDDVYTYKQPLVVLGKQTYEKNIDIVNRNIESWWKVHCLCSVSNCEIIGNKHDNPELIASVKTKDK